MGEAAPGPQGGSGEAAVRMPCGKKIEAPEATGRELVQSKMLPRVGFAQRSFQR